MENSISSSPYKYLSPSKHDGKSQDLPEESGWTEYLEDFSAYNRGEGEDDAKHDSSSFMSASMVSDARSGPEWKQRSMHNSLIPAIWSSLGGLPNMPKKLNFKKKRTQDIPYDDSLEDTASSPVNSPKMTMCFKRMDLNSRKADENNDGYMGKGIAIDEHEKMVINGGQKFNDNFGHDASGYVELKNKGLCLVPVSMVRNYLH